MRPSVRFDMIELFVDAWMALVIGLAFGVPLFVLCAR
jgi:hypothetical protein